jgi:enoyl-CoA hydratase
MGIEPKILSASDGSISVIRINNPRQKNALTAEVLDQLTIAVADAASSESTRTIIFTGAADIFASGANIRELQQLTRSDALEFACRGQQLFQSIANAKQLTIAAINGHCIGGGLDLALACELRFASRTATFRHPGATLGIITGWGGTQRLPRLIGEARTLELFTTARVVGSEEALEIGLIAKIADPVLDDARAFAQEFAARQKLRVTCD